jgi:hypothetical protein
LSLGRFSKLDGSDVRKGLAQLSHGLGFTAASMRPFAYRRRDCPRSRGYRAASATAVAGARTLDAVAGSGRLRNEVITVPQPSVARAALSVVAESLATPL